MVTSLDIVTTIVLKADKIINKRNTHKIHSPVKFTEFKCHQFKENIGQDPDGYTSSQIECVGCEYDSHESR